MEGDTLLGKLISIPLTDFQCLKSFSSGVESMDNFIRGDFRLSVENHYCQAYAVKFEDEIVAIFALSFDSLDLDSDDKEELLSGGSTTASPNVDFSYQDTFYAKPRYPAMDIAYLAIQEKWRGKHIGDFLIKQIADLARRQTLAGCQFLTVEALATKEYSAIGFYESEKNRRKPKKGKCQRRKCIFQKKPTFSHRIPSQGRGDRRS